MKEVKVNLGSCCPGWQGWGKFFTENYPIATIDLSQKWILSSGKRYELNKSKKDGFISFRCSYSYRNKYLDDIFGINTSKQERQGRVMSGSYLSYPSETTDSSNECKHHYTRFFACFAPSGQMVAYANIHFCGEVACISQILGHGEVMKHHSIMINLLESIINYCQKHKIKYLTYHLWLGGEEGLRQWKQIMKFEPIKIVP